MSKKDSNMIQTTIRALPSDIRRWRAAAKHVTDGKLSEFIRRTLNERAEKALSEKRELESRDRDG